MSASLLYWLGRCNRMLRWSWSRLHVRLYQSLRGRLLSSAFSRPFLLLTTTGRRTGLPHTVALTYMRNADDFVVIASSAGTPRDPDWCRNLRARPVAQLQVGREKFPVKADVVYDEALRERFRAYYPALSRIEADTTGRRIPLVVLRRA